MADVNFIEFGDDIGFIERVSPYLDFYTIRGIQLLPNNPLPYIQVTSVSGGIQLQDWTVFIVDCHGVETDITNYFVVEDVFVDENSDAQFVWSLTNVPFDFGYELVYLKAVQLAAQTFYSNYFILTEQESDFTCRLDYKGYDADYMQATQLRLAYKNPMKNQEIDSYYETSTKNTVVNVVKSQKFEIWQTDIISKDLLIKISDAFECKYTYLNTLRCNLFEAIDVKEANADENFSDNLIELAFNKSDVYDPLSPIITPQVVPTITLDSVEPNGVTAYYNFTYADFTPTYLVFEYSDDQTTWTSETLNITSPQFLSFNETGVWYFRIKHPLAISNVIDIDLGDEVIAFDDSYQLPKGTILDIEPMLNDTLVGNTTIASVSTPINGTATIIDSGTKIRYEHDDTFTAFDSFTYTISNGLTSDTATVSLVIAETSSTAFSMSNGTNEVYLGSILQVCYLPLGSVRYHNGAGVTPAINDFIFDEAGLITPFDGGNLKYAVKNGRWITINSLGKVTNKGIC